MAEAILIISSSDSDTDKNSDCEESNQLTQCKRVNHDLSERSSDSDCSLPEILSQRILPIIERSKVNSVCKDRSKPQHSVANTSHKLNFAQVLSTEDSNEPLPKSKFHVRGDSSSSSSRDLSDDTSGYASQSSSQNSSTDPSSFSKTSYDLTLVIEMSLCQEKFYDVLKDALENAKIAYTIEAVPVSGTMWWTDSSQKSSLVEKQIVQYLNCSTATSMVSNFKNNLAESEGDSFLSRAQKISRLYGDTQITFIIVGMEKYFRGLKAKKAREFREMVSGEVLSQQSQTQRKRKNLPAVTCTEFDFEEALVDLQLQANANVRCVENASDLASIIVSFTTSILDAPKKRLRQQHGFSWDVHGDSTGTVKIGKNVSDLYELWVQQLLQFHQVSKDMALAIASKYSSPQALVKAYQNCSNKDEARKLLQNIEVRRGIGPLSTSKRIGPELSYKIHALLTTNDPDEILHTS